MNETQDSLFPEAKTPGSSVWPNVTHFGPDFAGRWTLESLKAELPLEQKYATMYGKTFPVPRLECWFGDRPYAFGGRVEEPKPWPGFVLEIKKAVEAKTCEKFDSCFVNFYRDGSDAISWHADDEPWIGPVIASLSFGAARRFVMKSKRDRGYSAEFKLGDGDLLVMGAGVQQDWLHRVPREKDVTKPRLNFTFRQTVSS